MAQLRQGFDQFMERDAEVVVVGPDTAEAFARYWADNALPFIGLPDAQHSVLKLYGQQVNLFKLGRMPAQVTIDKSGIVRFVHFGKSMADIPENQELLAVLDQLNDEYALSIT